jgi:hypothetical protein
VTPTLISQAEVTAGRVETSLDKIVARLSRACATVAIGAGPFRMIGAMAGG